MSLPPQASSYSIWIRRWNHPFMAKQNLPTPTPTPYRMNQSILNYGMERAWALLAATKESNMLACGFDEGTVVCHTTSQASWTLHITCVLERLFEPRIMISRLQMSENWYHPVRGWQMASLTGGDNLSYMILDLVNYTRKCWSTINNTIHNCNGQEFVAVCGNGEFFIPSSPNTAHWVTS